MRIILFLYLLFFTLNIVVSQNSGYDVLLKSTKIVRSAKTMTYINYSTERIKGKLSKIGIAHTKVNRTPFKVYLRQEKENGAEILYNTTVSKETAKVSPGKFPYITLNLDPSGSLMHQGEHHTILEADIKYTYDIINYSLKKATDVSNITYLSKVKIKGETYYKIKLINNDYKIVKYKVKPNEDIIKIARELCLNDCSIVNLNSNIDDFQDVQTGQIINVPNYYAKETIMYINTETYLPYKVLVYDNNGLYESYEFRNLKINMKFKSNEFLETFPGYSF